MSSKNKLNSLNRSVSSTKAIKSTKSSVKEESVTVKSNSDIIKEIFNVETPITINQSQQEIIKEMLNIDTDQINSNIVFKLVDKVFDIKHLMNDISDKYHIYDLSFLFNKCISDNTIHIFISFMYDLYKKKNEILLKEKTKYIRIPYNYVIFHNPLLRNLKDIENNFIKLILSREDPIYCDEPCQNNSCRNHYLIPRIIQVRRADEGSSTFYICPKCNRVNSFGKS